MPTLLLGTLLSVGALTLTACGGGSTTSAAGSAQRTASNPAASSPAPDASSPSTNSDSAVGSAGGDPRLKAECASWRAKLAQTDKERLAAMRSNPGARDTRSMHKAARELTAKAATLKTPELRTAATSMAAATEQLAAFMDQAKKNPKVLTTPETAARLARLGQSAEKVTKLCGPLA